VNFGPEIQERGVGGRLIGTAVSCDRWREFAHDKRDLTGRIRLSACSQAYKRL
jgi:hypothetical protein